MADVVRIKRRVSPGSTGAPASLANAELAYNENDHTLYIGEGTGGGGGSASVIRAIAGDGLFVNAPLTGTPTAPTATAGTNTTQIATTQFVTGAIAGATAGVSSIAVTDGLTRDTPTGAVTLGISNNGIVNAKLATMAANTIKLNNTGSAATPIDGTIAQAMTLLAAAPLASPTFTGTPAAPTLSNGSAATTQLATTAYVRETRLDQLTAPTANVAFNNQRITGLAEPSNPQDAATRNYVDASIQGLQIKDTARLATAAVLPTCTYANGTAGAGATLTATSNAALSVDSVTVSAGDNILVKNQASGFQNGLYTVTQAGSGALPFILTRHTDMDLAAEYSGAFIPVGSAGSTNANTLWLANPTTPVTVGTTSIPFTQLNGATSITAGNGLTLTGNTIDAVGTASRISVAANAIDIDTAYVGQTSITTLGTIATGTWNATIIGVTKGGTGVGTLTGYVKGAGTANFTASATIPNTDITGLGTMATQNANAVNISGGVIDGVTFDGGSF